MIEKEASLLRRREKKFKIYIVLFLGVPAYAANNENG